MNTIYKNIMYTALQVVFKKELSHGRDQGEMVIPQSGTILVYLMTALLVLSSCGYYSFKGALPPHAKSIAIPLFDDRTSYPDVREYITNAVTDAFIADNTLAVVDEEQADLVMRGVIQSISQQVAAVAAGEVTSGYKIIVRIKLTVEDKVLNKTMVDKNLEQFSFLESNTGLDERNTAILEALDLLVDDIFNATLASW